jgi:hypothetical protein
MEQHGVAIHDSKVKENNPFGIQMDGPLPCQMTLEMSLRKFLGSGDLRSVGHLPTG